MSLIGISAKIGSGKDTVAEMIQYLLYKDNFDGDGLDNISLQGFSDLPQRKKNNLSGFLVKRFADEIKDTVCRWIGCTREQLEDREFKEKPLGEEWWYHRAISFGTPQDIKMFPYSETSEEEAITYKNIEETLSCMYEVDLIKLTPRKLMQLLGTEAGRGIIHPDIWVNTLFADYNPPMDKIGRAMMEGYTGEEIDYQESQWIIPDTRFKNEITRVDKYNGLKIRIERKTELRFPNLYDQFQLNSNYIDWEKYLKENWLDDYNKIYHESETALDDYEDWDYVINNNGTMTELLEKVKRICKKEKLI